MDGTFTYRRVGPTTRLHCKPLELPSVVDLDGSLLTNITGGGIRFCHDETWDPGTRLAMEMEVPGLPAAVLALGTVVSCRPNGTPTTHEIDAEIHWVGWDRPEAQEAIASRIMAALEQDPIVDVAPAQAASAASAA